MSSLSKLYLLIYNSLQSLGWGVALTKILISLASERSFHGAYASAGDLICFLQTISLLESVHGAFGLVPSGALFPLMQWGGRTHFLLAIVRQIPEVQELRSVFVTFCAWSVSEVIRYSHYAVTCVGIHPSWLTYVRYTAFIILYPIGLAPGEMWLMYRALSYIKERNLYSELFGQLHFSYYYFVVVLLICYPFLWLKLYLHLFKQRRAKLVKPKIKKKV